MNETKQNLRHKLQKLNREIESINYPELKDRPESGGLLVKIGKFTNRIENYLTRLFRGLWR